MKKKFIFFLFVVLGSVSLNAGGYVGVGYAIGAGNHSIEVDGIEADDGDTGSYSGYDIHAGFITSGNNRIELSYNSLSLGDDVTAYGLDYIHTLGKSGFVPYIGGGLSYTSMDEVQFTNGDSFNGIGFRMRAGAFIEINKNLEAGIEINYNRISWETIEAYSYYDSKIHDIDLSTSFYGLGFNVNYKF